VEAVARLSFCAGYSIGEPTKQRGALEQIVGRPSLDPQVSGAASQVSHAVPES
jgi:hypothetical protein